MPKLRSPRAALLSLTIGLVFATGLLHAAPVLAGNMPALIMRERFVEDNVFTSTHAPSVRIAVDHQLAYLGRLEFSSGAYATERYLFGATREQTVERLFVVEVSGAEDAGAEGSDEIEVGGERYGHTTRVLDHADKIRKEPAAALARTTAYLEKQGFRLPDHLIVGRLSRPAGADRSKRFEIHYLEDVRNSGRAVVPPTGSDLLLDRGDQTAAQLTERFLASFRVLDR